MGNFTPLKFQYVDAVAGVNRFFFQPGGERGLMLAHEVGLRREISKTDRTKLFKTFIKRRLQRKELSEIIPERNVLPPKIIMLSNKERQIYEKLRDFLSKGSRYYQIISRSIERIAPFVKITYLEELISSKDAALFALNNLRERIEVAFSSEIEQIMAQLELKEIDEELLKEKLKSHITERKEIFELLEELPSEEAELIQLGFTNNLIDEIDEIIGELLKIGRNILDLRIQRS